MGELITKEEAMANSEKKMRSYRLGDACEWAFGKYEAALIRAGKGELLADKDLRRAVSRVFFSAGSVEQLQAYMMMEPKEIAALSGTE